MAQRIGVQDEQCMNVQRPDNEHGIIEIESLCMNCHEEGTTRIFLIHIPYFKEVLLESFFCDHCGFKNSSVQSAGAIQEKGATYTFRIDSEDDFQRQVVRSEAATFKIKDLDLEMPAGAGQLTNLESMFSKILTDLQKDQPDRKTQNPNLHDALATIIHRLTHMLELSSFPITVTLDDPSGNSFLEPSTSDKAAKYTRTDYVRTHEQNILLGLAADDELSQQANDHPTSTTDDLSELDIVDGQVYELPTSCPACTHPCTVNMRQVHIPHFKEVIIMATVCEHCGYRTSDVKTGGAIPELGQRITVRILRSEDLSRDILKSETCALSSVELDLEVQPGTLGGRFTTVEGLLTQVRDQLRGQIFHTDSDDDEHGRILGDKIQGGDSMSTTVQANWTSFFAKLDQAIRAEIEFSITLQDPLANSYVQSLVDEGEDPQIVKEEYQRTAEEIEDLGLGDMKTEGYEEDGDEIS